MKTLPCTVCGAESYERKEGSRTVILCPMGHQRANSVQEWNDAYANKTITVLLDRIDKLEEELNDALHMIQSHESYKQQRDEARSLVRKLLDPDWQAAGIEKKAFKVLRDWGLGAIG
jgi:hypothetical protein